MFSNLKKRIQGSLTNTPVRAFGAADDQIRKEENDNLSKDSAAEVDPSVEQPSRDATTASDDFWYATAAGDVTSSSSSNIVPDSQSIAPVSTSVKPPVLSTLDVAVEQIKDHGQQNINLNEIEDLAKAQDEYLTDVTTLDVADLQESYRKLQTRSRLYKSQVLQILSAYKEMETEKEQVKVSFTRAEEKHRRQISELKEQIQLDSQAKRDLENNYSLMLDEKDEMIQVLRMKIKLIKDGSSAEGKGSSSDSKHQLDVTGDSSADGSFAQSDSQLKEKVKRLELLLTKCKDTIKSNKERIQQLASDRDAMAKLAQEKTDELEKFKEQSGLRIADLQSELAVHQMGVTEQTSSKGGTTGQEMVLKEQLMQLENQNKLLQEKVAKLEKKGQEQLEKSREIIRQLKEQKRHLEDEVKQLQTPNPSSVPEPTEQESRNTSESVGEKTQEALESKIKDLLEEIEKLKAESEENLRVMISRNDSELASLQERLQVEHEKSISEIDAMHEQRLAEVVTENEKATKRMEMEFAEKLEKQTTLLEQQRIDFEKMKSDDREVADLRQRLLELKQQAEWGRGDLETQKEKSFQILEEKRAMEERIRELEGIVDSQRDVIGKAEAEIGCLNHDLITKSDEFNLTVKNYQDEIERLRIEVEHKILAGVEKNVPEIKDAGVNSMQTDFEHFRQEDEPKALIDLEVEGESELKDEPKVKSEANVEVEPKVKDEPKLEGVNSMQTDFEHFQQEAEQKALIELGVEDESEPKDEPKVKSEANVEIEPKVKDEPKLEDKLEEKCEPKRGVMSPIEMENRELKELNRTLTDALEVERAKVIGCLEEIEQVKMDAAKQLGETSQRLTSSTELIVQLEQRMNDAMERENQLNMDLETAKIDNEQNLALRNEEILSLQTTINELKSSELALRDTSASQNERISSLQETIDQLKMCEQDLKEKNASQSEEIKSLLETLSQKNTLEEASRELNQKNLALFSEEVSSLKASNEELKNSRKTLEETVASHCKSISSLEAENEELRNSKQTLEEAMASQSEDITSLEAKIEELRISKQTLEEAMASQNEDITSLEAKNEELRNSKQTLEETTESQRKEIDSLQAAVVTLRATEQTLKEENLLSGNEQVKSLQDINDQLRSSEQTLKEANASLKEDLGLLQTETSQLKNSEQGFKEKYMSQSEQISSLQATVDELKISEQALKDKIASQSKDLSLLQATVDELRSLEQALNDKDVSQSKEIRSLQTIIDELKSSEQVLIDKSILQSKEISSLHTTIDELRSIEQALRETIVSQNEEMKSNQAVTDELRTSEKASKEAHAQELALQKEEIRLLQETVYQNRIPEQAKKQRLQDSEQRCLVSMEQTYSELGKDVSTVLEKDPEEARSAYEEAITATKQRPNGSALIISQKIGLENKTLDVGLSDDTDGSFENSDLLEMSPVTWKQQFESGSLPSLDNVQLYVKKKQQKFQLQLKHQNEEGEILDVIQLKETQGQYLFDTPDQQLSGKVTADCGREAEEVIKSLKAEVDSLNKRLLETEIIQKQFNEGKQALLEQLKTLEETGDHKAETELHLELHELEEKAIASLEIISLKEQVKHLNEEVLALKEASGKSLLSSEGKSASRLEQLSEQELFQKEGTAESLQTICKEQEKRIKDLEDELANALENCKAVHEKLNKLEQGKTETDVDYDMDIALKFQEKEDIKRELEEMKISKRRYEEELQDLKRETETCTKIKSSAKTQVEESVTMDSEGASDVGTEVKLEADAKVESDASDRESVLQSIQVQHDNKHDELRTNLEHEIEILKKERDNSAEFYEKRIADLEQAGLMLQEDLTILMEKLNTMSKRCTNAEKAAKHYKQLLKENENVDLMSQLQLDVELEPKLRDEEVVRLKNELEEQRMESQRLTQKLKQVAEEKQLLEILSGSAGEVKQLTCVASAESVKGQSFDEKSKGTWTVTSSLDGACTEFGSESHKTENSAKFYEARIADLEQTGTMLQEDVTILMEKLNAMTERCSQAEKDAEYYKQLSKDQKDSDLKCQSQEDLEMELRQRLEEVAQLKKEREEQRTESQKLSEKFKQAVEKEKLTRRLQTNLEEFEKCGAATVGSFEEQQLNLNSIRTSAADVSSSLRENVEHIKGGVEGVPGPHKVSGVCPDVVGPQLNLLSLEPVPLDQSSGELQKIKSSSQWEEIPPSLREHYEDEFKKLKSGFKSELRKHAMENNRLKELQKELLHEVEVLKSSIQVSTSGDVKLYVTEPTELEYLRNILYKYMLGMETKTLAKVICTVVKFSPDETRKVLEREDSRNKVFSPSHR